MSKIVLASTFATLFCASLAAQATQTPSPSPSTPAVSQPAGGTTPQAPTGAPPQSTRPAAKADSITVEGCIQRGAPGSATAGATGTSGSAASAFMLTTVTKPAGTSGSSASSSAPVASSYKLDADSSKLTPHVGQKVEISGTIDPAGPSSSSASASAATAVPTLKVDNVKMLAATCSN